MTTTPPAQAALFAALARAIVKSSAVGKDAQNTFHRYKYASAEAVIAEARDALAEEGIAAIPASWALVPRDCGDIGYFADVRVTYLVTHADGGSLPCETSTPALREKGRPEDKAVATALTYSLGYFLRGLLMLPRVDAEHDVDRRDDRDERGRAQRQAPPAKPAGPAFDLAAAIAAMEKATTLEALRALGATYEAAPESAKGKLGDVYKACAARLRTAKQEAAA